MIHPSDEEISLYAVDRELVDRPDFDESHFINCARCRAAFDDHRRFDESLRSLEPWRIADPAADTHKQALRAMALQTQHEDEEAGRLLAPLLDDSARVAWNELVNDHKYRTGGVVRRLCEAAHQTCAALPSRALMLSKAAVAISMMLPDDFYPARTVSALRGMGWKEVANALRFLDRFTEAIEALTRAESFYRELGQPELDLAIVAAIRAYVLMSMADLDGADESARAALAIFRHLGQETRYLYVMSVEGCVLRWRGKVDLAIHRLREVLDLAESTGDAVWRATAATNLAWCYIDTGELQKAADLFQEGRTAFRDVGSASDATRCDWGLAVVCRDSGNHHEALAQLLAVSAAFGEQQVIVDSATAMVEAFEIMLALGEADDIERLATGLVTTLTEAGKMESALTAVAYIKEAATRKSVTPEMLRAASAFLRRVDRQHDLIFSPPPVS